jgi:hypothetical protein
MSLPLASVTACRLLMTSARPTEHFGSCMGRASRRLQSRSGKSSSTTLSLGSSVTGFGEIPLSLHEFAVGEFQKALRIERDCTGVSAARPCRNAPLWPLIWRSTAGKLSRQQTRESGVAD